MPRTERTCLRCRQLNVRYTGTWSWLRNPKYPLTCTYCGADLATGERDAFGAAQGIAMRFAVYAVHALVGIGACTVGTALLWPGIARAHSALRLLPVVSGAVVGLALARRSDRAGTLLARANRSNRS